MGGSRARGNWEQTQGQTQSQTQHKQRPQVPAITFQPHHHLSRCPDAQGYAPVIYIVVYHPVARPINKGGIICVLEALLRVLPQANLK